jgi:outer membrane protein assembly factor BamE (lipoprotein component of BamABCDE complex)
MAYRSPLPMLVLALAGSLVAASDAPHSGPAHELQMDRVGKISVGSTTRAGVTQLLGRPWRTVHYGDCNAVEYQELWEYWGHDANAGFKITIAFDDSGIARTIARSDPTGAIKVLAADPQPHHQH